MNIDLVHIAIENHRVTHVIVEGKEKKAPSSSIIPCIYDIAEKYPYAWIYFYRPNFISEETRDFLLQQLKHTNQFITVYAHEPLLLDESIGYVELGPFINVNYKVLYPTWRMATDGGILHASVLNNLNRWQEGDTHFGYWLNSLARTLRYEGLMCYRYHQNSQPPSYQKNQKLLYRFVKQHFKFSWLMILFFCQWKYEKQFSLAALIKSLWYRKRQIKISLEQIFQPLRQGSLVPFQLDVVIPTLGRKEYLHQVFKDISRQTLLPQKVIVVEQDPDLKATSNLPFINSVEWPFNVQHIFTHKSGACHARNKALEQTQAPWILLFDDDARLAPDTFEKMQKALEETGAYCINTAYLQEGEKEFFKPYKQWESFGAGCSIIHCSILDQCRFDEKLEHGYGEDVDFGMQIRNLGYDIIYTPQIQIRHLKAPVGGFRQPPTFPWDGDPVSPKPSPQVYYSKLKHFTSQQLKAYQWTLFFKIWKHQKFSNPFRLRKRFLKRWNASVYWAERL